MARVVVLGGGIAGHTAALHLTRMLKGSDEVVVVTPNSKWNWIRRTSGSVSARSRPTR